MQLMPKICLIDSYVHGNSAGRHLTSVYADPCCFIDLHVTYVMHCARFALLSRSNVIVGIE